MLLARTTTALGTARIDGGVQRTMLLAKRTAAPCSCPNNGGSKGPCYQRERLMCLVLYFTLSMEGQNTTKNKQLATQLTFGDGQKCGADAKRNGQLHWHITQAHAWATTQIARGLLCTSTEIVDMPTCEQTTNKKDGSKEAYRAVGYESSTHGRCSAPTPEDAQEKNYKM